MGNLAEPTETGIEGVALFSLRVIEDARGAVLHLMKANSPIFKKFGEVYFSEVKSGAVKAWKRHLRMTQHLAVPVGKVRFVVVDARLDSVTKSHVGVWTLGRPDCYSLLVIPPGVWYGFQGVSADASLIANCADLPHDPTEVERLPEEALGPENCWLKALGCKHP